MSVVSLNRDCMKSRSVCSHNISKGGGFKKMFSSPGFEIVKHAGLVEVCEVAHILASLELGRVHLVGIFWAGYFIFMNIVVNSSHQELRVGH